jgi:hypothetical protein
MVLLLHLFPRENLYISPFQAVSHPRPGRGDGRNDGTTVYWNAIFPPIAEFPEDPKISFTVDYNTDAGNGKQPVQRFLESVRKKAVWILFSHTNRAILMRLHP